MALVLRAVTDDAWAVAHSTLAVREAGEQLLEPAGRALSEEQGVLSVSGRVARAGDGWVFASARSDDAHVTLQLLDGPPPPGPVEAGAVAVETPHLSTSGRVGLDALVAVSGGAELALDGPGGYRLRVHRAPLDGDEPERWTLSFWRDADPASGPVWLAVPPVVARDDAREARNAWRSVLPYDAVELLDPLQQAGTPMTRADLDGWWRRHGRTASFLDEPLLPAPRTLTTGFDDVDAARADGQRGYRDEQREQWRDLAAQLRLPTPTSRAEVLPLLVACGLLERDPEGALRLAAAPPEPGGVLALPPEVRTSLERQRRWSAHAELAADVEAVVLWAGGTLEVPLTELAARLLADPEQVAGALRFAAREGRLTGDLAAGAVWLLTAVVQDEPDLWDEAWVGDATWADDGSDDGTDVAELVSTTSAELTYEAVWLDTDDETASTYGDEVSSSRRRSAPLPTGPAPAHGVIVDGDLWLPAGDGRLRRVPVGDDGVERAVATPHGWLLSGLLRTVLVAGDGVLHELGDPEQVVVRPGGQQAALLRAEYGRRSSSFGVDVVDLATRALTAVPWRDDRRVEDVAWQPDGTLALTAENDPDDPATDGLVLSGGRAARPSRPVLSCGACTTTGCAPGRTPTGST